ncbi:hypothetical protein QF035_003338 [Streptomyces umbrinus]|uniref:Uncharacterized protein n=1 Tax=Streptomyces umbrinus TaxID=67370 RepID=A0ABU0SQB5_9ACTN|nr:hypothetical protein [Streptomyces umbrinus]
MSSTCFFTDLMPRLRRPKATFSKMSRCGKSAYDWKTVFTGRLYGGRFVTSWSPSRTEPEEGSSRPAIMRSVVVLPQPEAPRSAKNEPWGTVRSSGWTAVKEP